MQYSVTFEIKDDYIHFKNGSHPCEELPLRPDHGSYHQLLRRYRVGDCTFEIFAYFLQLHSYPIPAEMWIWTSAEEKPIKLSAANDLFGVKEELEVKGSFPGEYERLVGKFKLEINKDDNSFTLAW